ncbi:carbohydrate-binding protein, partial [Actinoplanes sp. TFC3]|uniref:carbohydrate-binding protein n=1 Tax=Actinoplanes sp. TFC3 TaxID=1710355 RepID=UPI003516169F
MGHLHRWIALAAGAATLAAGVVASPAVLAAPAGGAVVMVACSAPAWAEGTSYAAGAQVTYAGRLYRARVAHTPPAGAGWTPVAAASLWEDLGACDGTTPPTTPPPTTPPPTTPPPA